jgi:hypothetical protein
VACSLSIVLRSSFLTKTGDPGDRRERPRLAERAFSSYLDCERVPERVIAYYKEGGVRLTTTTTLD